MTLEDDHEPQKRDALILRCFGKLVDMLSTE